MSAAAQIVRKSEFAAMRNVSPGRVSQWIAEGKIGPEALVGEGRQAQINVSVANSHLRERLDPNQRFGLNGINTAIPQSMPAAALSGAAHIQPASFETQFPPSAAPTPDKDDSVEAQIKREKLRQQQLATERLEEEAKLRQGIYVLARTARDENLRVAGEMMKVFDGALSDFSNAIAAKFEIPTRDILHLLRSEFRRVRERASKAVRETISDLPELIDIADDEIEVPPLQ